MLSPKSELSQLVSDSIEEYAKSGSNFELY
jgi:hypothetical protein